MNPLGRMSFGRGSVFRRRLAWPILILAVAVPLSFFSGRLERQRSTAAVSFGEAVAMWDGEPVVPDWLEASAGHPFLLHDLARRLGDRPADAEEVQVSASSESDASGAARWRVRLAWPETPSVDLLVSFDGLELQPRLVSVGTGPFGFEAQSQ